MQNINDTLANMEDIGFPTAEQVKAITATPEDLYQAKLFSAKNNLADTIVQVARQQGLTQYSQKLKPDGEIPRLIEDLSEFVKSLGYTASVRDVVEPTMDGGTINLIELTLGWDV